MNQKTIFTAVFLAAGALAAGVTGCELISTIDRSLIDGTGGNGTSGTTSTATATTTGGTGGAMSSGTGGATSSSSGTGGATACSGGAMACAQPSECPDPQNDCILRTCDQGCCGTSKVADGIATANGQTAGDCKKVVCDGAGVSKSTPDNLDPTDDSNPCTVDTCIAGGTVHTNIVGACTVGGTVCGDPAGPAAGMCVACNVSSDCSGGSSCKANLCVPVGCSNGVKDGTETDLDCGGVACGATCADSLTCASNGDCVNGYCNALVCTLPTCNDNTVNGNETGKDCGGAGFKGAVACAKCADTIACKVGSDCSSGFCNPSTLLCATATCNDGFKNGSETGVDCGGAACDAVNKTCAVGGACTTAADCVSGFCQNGTTCALKPNSTLCGGGTECTSGLCSDGVCCNTACGNGCSACNLAGSAGVCTAIAAGSVPVVGAGKSTCATTAPASCGNNGVCNGAGACANWPGTTVCRPSAGNCDVSENCDGLGACPADGFVSAASVCRIAAGACDMAESCTGVSAACPADGITSAGTTCAPASCSGGSLSTHTCDGSATSCGSSSAPCPGNFVCAGATSCKTACAADADCNGVFYCNNPGPTGTCVAKLATGTVCTAGNECLSGTCIMVDAGFNTCL